MDLRMGDAVPPVFVEEFTDIVNKRKFKEASRPGPPGYVLSGPRSDRGHGRLQYGIEDAREAALNTVESIRAGKESLTSYLAVIGSLGPLIGLVGTVYSMIGAFMKMSDKSATLTPMRGRNPVPWFGGDPGGRGPSGAGHLFQPVLPQSVDAHLDGGFSTWPMIC